MSKEMETYIRELVAIMDAERKNASCYLCGKKEECMYEGHTIGSYKVWCNGCVQWYKKSLEKISWKPEDRCDCDCCSDAKALKRVPVPDECELYPYWTFSKVS